jgi:hypothetical protein
MPRDIYPTREIAGTLVGTGWAHLLDEAFQISERSQIPILQIKEESGGLRVAFDRHGRPSAEQISGVSREIKLRSYATCEACGWTGRLRNEFGWWKVLCDDHGEMCRQGPAWEEIFGYQPYTTPID